MHVYHMDKGRRGVGEGQRLKQNMTCRPYKSRGVLTVSNHCLKRCWGVLERRRILGLVVPTPTNFALSVSMRGGGGEKGRGFPMGTTPWRARLVFLRWWSTGLSLPGPCLLLDLLRLTLDMSLSGSLLVMIPFLVVMLMLGIVSLPGAHITLPTFVLLSLGQSKYGLSLCGPWLPRIQ